MAKETKAKPVQFAMPPTGVVSASNIGPTWTNYWNTTGSGSPNIAWQGTTSGATYSAASSVLSSTG